MHFGMPECHKPFLGHCDLDLWPSFKNYCVQSISTILFDVGIPNWWWFLLGRRSDAYHFESLWPWHWLLASFLGFSCYITANFPQMCLMLDQFLWGHSSRVCDISCYPVKRHHSSLRYVHVFTSRQKQCGSWSDDFIVSHLIWIYSVFKNGLIRVQ